MTRKDILAIISLLLSLNLPAQEVIHYSLSTIHSLHVESAGALSALLGENANQITDLTLTGTLNGSDFKAIREMGNLSTLNLADVNTVTGGDPIYRYGPFYSNSRKDEITQYTFYGLKKLTSVITPNNATAIGVFAFYLCPNLTSVTIGNSVITIEDFVFANSPRLQTMTIPDNVTSIGNYTFFACKGLTSVDLGNGAASVGTKCFQNCTALTSVKIGSAMTSVGEGAFQNCTGLTEIHVKNPIPPSAGMNCFLNVPITCKIHVPEGSVDAYRSASGWRDFSYIDATATIPVPLQANIKLHPNPFTGEVYLTGAEGCVLQVVAVTGVVMHTQKVVQANETLTLGSIPSGIYFFRFEKDGKVETLKAIKK